MAAAVVSGYDSSKTFQIGTGTRFLVAYVFTDNNKATIKDHDGFDIALNDLGDEELAKIIAALVAANTWAQAQLNPVP